MLEPYSNQPSDEIRYKHHSSRVESCNATDLTLSYVHRSPTLRRPTPSFHQEKSHAHTEDDISSSYIIVVAMTIER